MDKLERYYEKFKEEKRLQRRHGQVEFFVTWQFLKKYLDKFNSPKIVDIGAGTGAYCLPLSKLGYDVTAVEYVKSNLQKLKAQKANIKTFQGDAKNLSMFNDDNFDITLVLGPIYHSISAEEKIKILNESKRITKNGGIIFVAYYMNDYGIIRHGFMDGNIKREIELGNVDKNFHIIGGEDSLYSFDRMEDIEYYNKKANLKRITIFAPDGCSDYMRDVLNKMDTETFEIFKKYQLCVSENKSLIGASSHLVDVLMVEK